MKSSLLGIVGPAALAAGAIAGVSRAITATEDAFAFKAALDATTASITAQLRGVRDSGQVFQEAASFGREFKLTQQETTEAIAASIGVMRASKAPIEDILGVLARMQVLSPEQSLQEAAVALKAFAAGDTTSLVTRFEVGRDVANQMKKEIQGGADAVAVMSRFLGDTGIGMDTLKAKTEGAAGAMKDAAVQAEKFKLALAGQAGGLGEDLLGFKTNLLKEFTAILSGDVREIEARNQANAAAQEAYNQALREGKSAAEAYVIAQEVIRSRMAQAAETIALGAEANAVHAERLMGVVAATDATTAATDAATAAMQKNMGETALANVESQALAAQQQLLELAARQAAGGLVTGADAAAEAEHQRKVDARHQARIDAAIDAYKRQARAGFPGSAAQFEAAWPRLLEDWQISEAQRAMAERDTEIRRRVGDTF